MVTINRKTYTSIWQYLDDTGVLDTGNEEAIKKAKKKYWKAYFTAYKRARRSTRPEYSVSVPKDQDKILKEAAQKHNMSVSAFMREAAVAYTTRRYLVPDAPTIAALQQTLSRCHNEIQAIGQKETNNIFRQTKRYRQLEKRITNLERHIDRQFRQPLSIDQLVVNAIHNNPALQAHLHKLLNHDRQNKNHQEQKRHPQAP